MYRGWGGSCGCGCGGRWGRGRENCGGTGCGFCFASFASFRFVSFCFSFRIDSFFVSFCLTFCFAPFLVTVSVSVLVVYRVEFRSPFRVLLQSFRFDCHCIPFLVCFFASFRFLVSRRFLFFVTVRLVSFLGPTRFIPFCFFVSFYASFWRVRLLASRRARSVRWARRGGRRLPYATV